MSANCKHFTFYKRSSRQEICKWTTVMKIPSLLGTTRNSFSGLAASIRSNGRPWCECRPSAVFPHEQLKKYCTGAAGLKALGLWLVIRQHGLLKEWWWKWWKRWKRWKDSLSQIEKRCLVSSESTVIAINDNVKCHYETKHNHFREKCEKSSSVILDNALVVILIIRSLISFISWLVILGSFPEPIFTYTSQVIRSQVDSRDGWPFSCVSKWISSDRGLIGMVCTLTRVSLPNVLHLQLH